MPKYTKEFTIPYYDCDKDGYIRPENLLTYMAETSSMHSDKIGAGLKELRENNYCWMLNRWRVRFLKYPKVLEKVNIETWCAGINKFYATREFIVYDQTGEIVVKASTQWVFLDLIKLRPIRVPLDFGKIYGECKDRVLEDYYDFKKDLKVDQGLEFRVRRADIDYNNHVNNVIYLNWMLETIPDPVVENNKLYDLDIFYKKEIKGGAMINSALVGEEGDDLKFLHKISGGEEVHAFGRTVWR